MFNAGKTKWIYISVITVITDVNLNFLPQKAHEALSLLKTSSTSPTKETEGSIPLNILDLDNALLAWIIAYRIPKYQFPVPNEWLHVIY